jgi:hypothetical protein
MFERLRAFAARHKRKLIASAVVVGGSYAVWKFLVPKLLDYYVQRMLSQGVMKDLLGQLEQGDQKPRDPEEVKQEKFEHSQEVSDTHTQKALSGLDVRLQSLFPVEARQADLTGLSKTCTKEEKLECFKAVQVECLGRSIASLYMLHLVLLLHRVQFNIVQRALTDDGSREKSDATQEGQNHAAFIECDRHVLNDGLLHICDSLRTAIKDCWAAEGFEISTKMSAERLTSFLVGACRAADAALLDSKIIADTLLPKALDSGASTQVVKLLEEARDYCESPHFLEVHQSVLASGVKHLVESLATPLDATETGPPLASDASVLFVKLGGFLVKRVNQDHMLSVEDADGYVRRFAQEPLVGKLCKAVFFQEGAKQ